MRKSFFLIFFSLLLALPMRAEGNVVYLTTEQFRQRVWNYTAEKEWNFVGERPCIIDFYTVWCGPCKRLAPIMEELSETYCGQVDFYKVDTEKEQELAYLFQINSIPQVLYVPKSGRPTLLKGLYPKENIVQIIEHLLLGHDGTEKDKE